MQGTCKQNQVHSEYKYKSNAFQQKHRVYLDVHAHTGIMLRTHIHLLVHVQ